MVSTTTISNSVNALKNGNTPNVATKKQAATAKKQTQRTEKDIDFVANAENRLNKTITSKMKSTADSGSTMRVNALA